jgi:hypothetical protein
MNLESRISGFGRIVQPMRRMLGIILISAKRLTAVNLEDCRRGVFDEAVSGLQKGIDHSTTALTEHSLLLLSNQYLSKEVRSSNAFWKVYLLTRTSAHSWIFVSNDVSNDLEKALWRPY